MTTRLTLLDGEEWLACSAREFGHVGTIRHIGIKGRLSVLCGASATRANIWRRDSRKRPCPLCLEVVATQQVTNALIATTKKGGMLTKGKP